MKLTPAYGDTPILTIDPDLVDPVTPMIRQRDRLAASLATLDDAQWAGPSRCDGWSAQDVMTHLISTNQFWAFSINLALAGTPSRFLADFDPVASPAQLVEDSPATKPADTLDQFIATNAALADAAGAIGDRLWTTLGEAPPGHLPLGAVLLHALWDSWIHERDIFLPLGIEPVTDDEEIRANLAYVAALSPMFSVVYDAGRHGCLDVRTTRPDTSFLVEVGEHVHVHRGAAPAEAVEIAADAVALIEAMSYRGPWPITVSADDQWLFAGLGEAFDVAG